MVGKNTVARNCIFRDSDDFRRMSGSKGCVTSERSAALSDRTTAYIMYFFSKKTTSSFCTFTQLFFRYVHRGERRRMGLTILELRGLYFNVRFPNTAASVVFSKHRTAFTNPITWIVLLTSIQSPGDAPHICVLWTPEGGPPNLSNAQWTAPHSAQMSSVLAFSPPPLAPPKMPLRQLHPPCSCEQSRR